MIRAIAATVIALGFAGTALADGRHHDRHDRGHHARQYDNHRHDRRYDDRRHDRRYHATPRYDYRYRAPRPRGWHPGWRERHGHGYRYWTNGYYYVVPYGSGPSLSVTIPLR